MEHDHASHDMPKIPANYRPLLIIIGLITLAAFALQGRQFEWDWATWMNDFMGLFFLLFALFKLLDLKGFAEGFARYDWVTRRWWKPYATLYPFIELALALGYLSGIAPIFTCLVTVAVMGISAYGVVTFLRKGEHISCVCLGTVVNLPLSTISVLENVGMGLMAFLMLIELL